MQRNKAWAVIARALFFALKRYRLLTNDLIPLSNNMWKTMPNKPRNALYKA